MQRQSMLVELAAAGGTGLGAKCSVKHRSVAHDLLKRRKSVGGGSLVTGNKVQQQNRVTALKRHKAATNCMQQSIILRELGTAKFGEHGGAATAQPLIHAPARGTVVRAEGVQNRIHRLLGLLKRDAEAQHGRHLEGCVMRAGEGVARALLYPAVLPCA
jgi:hypothetical protein